MRRRWGIMFLYASGVFALILSAAAPTTAADYSPWYSGATSAGANHSSLNCRGIGPCR
jgi:hypothetical protein